MAATKGVNSYVSLAEAMAYFDNKLDVAAWVDADDAQKEQALVTATRTLDTLEWKGSTRQENQVLAFPREGSFFDPSKGREVVFGESIPQRLLDATCELAYHLLNNDGLLDDVGSVKSVSVGSISIQEIRSANSLPNIVSKLLRPMRTQPYLVWRAW